MSEREREAMEDVRADRVLDAYRERRRQRRGEDTYFGSADCLLRTDRPQEWERRRSKIREDAREAGMPADLAHMLYDLAMEEGLEPELGFELVRAGLGVLPPDEGISNAAAQPTADKYLPEWMFPAMPGDELLRERTLRISFRRLRGLLEAHEDANEAFRAFAAEPDVGTVGY